MADTTDAPIIDVPWLEAHGFVAGQQNRDGTCWVRESGETRLVARPTGHSTFEVGLDTSDRRVVRDLMTSSAGGTS